jgi:hypothetical protein
MQEILGGKTVTDPRFIALGWLDTDRLNPFTHGITTTSRVVSATELAAITQGKEILVFLREGGPNDLRSLFGMTSEQEEKLREDCPHSVMPENSPILRVRTGDQIIIPISGSEYLVTEVQED